MKLGRELSDDYMIVMAGVTQKIRVVLSNRIFTIDLTVSQKKLCRLYGAADVFINPTIQDNYPTVNLEASACGTPVVTYDTEGVQKIVIRHHVW